MIVHLILLALAAAAFISLCTAMPRYQAAMIGRKLPERRTAQLRLLGWTLIGLLLAIACFTFGCDRGPILCLGYATLGAAVAVALANRQPAPR